MTWKRTSTSGTNSSTASSLFGLDEDSKSNILVYKYRSGAKALEITTEHELCRTLDEGEPTVHTNFYCPHFTDLRLLPSSDPNLAYMRVTKKKIPRGNSRLEVRAEDLLPPEDLEKFGDKKPTLKSSLANVGLPSSAYWKRLLFKSYEDLYIVSRSIHPSPEASKGNSPSSPQHVSPSTTFPSGTAHPLQDPQAS